MLSVWLCLMSSQKILCRFINLFLWIFHESIFLFLCVLNRNINLFLTQKLTLGISWDSSYFIFNFFFFYIFKQCILYLEISDVKQLWQLILEWANRLMLSFNISPVGVPIKSYSLNRSISYACICVCKTGSYFSIYTSLEFTI